MRIAWWLITVTILNGLATSRVRCASIEESVSWFTRDVELTRDILGCVSGTQLQEADSALQQVALGSNLAELLPFVLEPHGHITRQELETSASAKRVRQTKKDTGVYYTPTDVANFMVTAAAVNGHRGTWLDPACGTGVFLRAAFRLIVHREGGSTRATELARSCIYGIDKSALAIELAAFVLLWELPTIVEAPLVEWTCIKKQLLCMDSMRIANRHTTDLWALDSPTPSIEALFPDVGDAGFDHIVMNPPYARLALDAAAYGKWCAYGDKSIGSSVETHLAFTEMLWRFGNSSSAGAAVLPLSIGANTGTDYQALRRGLLDAPGLKELHFFDREPQALFGEDIKTRNVVLFLDRSGTTEVRTSRLLKWTAAQRPTIFTRGRSTPVPKEWCTTFIPKLGTEAEATLYARLREHQGRSAPRIHRAPLDELVSSGHACSVLVSPTAYNFVNCFFADSLPSDGGKQLSASPVAVITGHNRQLAMAHFALLKSRICYWLWHVEGDGFHVSNEFIRRLPVWATLEDAKALRQLARLGEMLWESTRRRVVASVNGGRLTYSFHNGHDHPCVRETDLLIARQLDCGEVDHVLTEFIRSAVFVDGRNRTRSYIEEA